MLYVIREHHPTVGQGELVDNRTPTPPPPPSPSVFLLRMNGPEKVEAQQHDKEKCTYCLVYTYLLFGRLQIRVPQHSAAAAP